MKKRSLPARCPFCGLENSGDPERCAHCDTILRHGTATSKIDPLARRRVRSNAALSDLFFLAGLVLGGPTMTVGGDLELGLFMVLAGATASALRRYSNWSSLGCVIVATSTAAVVASLVAQPPTGAEDDTGAGAAARVAYVTRLSDQLRDGLIETRGPGAVTVWFMVPEAVSGECGEFPPPHIRDHLADLRFLRVVVADRNPGGGMCSFRP